MRIIHPGLIGVLLLGCLLAGCNSLGDGTPTKLSHGPVKAGDTVDMVLGALGRPDQQADVPSGAHYASVWTYRNYFNPTEKPQDSGWKEVTTPETRNQKDELVHTGVLKDIPQSQFGGSLRVTFVGGVVSSVDRVR